jgi:hypothetical protein
MVGPESTAVKPVRVSGSGRERSSSMFDAMMVVLGFVLFMLFVGYTVLCDKM